MSTRILLADDHLLVRAGIRALLGAIPGIDVVGEATTGEEAVTAAQQLVPDVALLDISMQGMNGLEAARRIVDSQPTVRVIMLSMHASEDYVARALRAGALGYLMKGSASQELVAIQPGGASSNFLGPDRLDVPLDFEPMVEAGSMLGAGAVVVVAEGTDLLAAATNVLRFFRNESCGKCVPCRVGSQKAVDLLERVLAKTARREDLVLFPELDEALRLTSICGLGQVVLNPVTSVFTHFPDELERRIAAKA